MYQGLLRVHQSLAGSRGKLKLCVIWGELNIHGPLPVLEASEGIEDAVLINCLSSLINRSSLNYPALGAPSLGHWDSDWCKHTSSIQSFHPLQDWPSSSKTYHPSLTCGCSLISCFCQPQSVFSHRATERFFICWSDPIVHFFRLKLSDGWPSHSRINISASPHSILSSPSWYWFKGVPSSLPLPGSSWNYVPRSLHSLSPLALLGLHSSVTPPLRSFPQIMLSPRLAALTISHFFFSCLDSYFISYYHL